MDNVIDTKKVVKLGVRRKDEIRECFFCKQDCRKTYYSDKIDNKKVWICKDCFKKMQKEIKMAKAICSECGSSVEIVEGEEWGYCPMCENDQVELKRKAKEMGNE